MSSFRYRSVVFKFLLAGLLALLVASYSVDAAPTGKLPAKAPAKAVSAARAKPMAVPKAAGKGKAPAKASQAKPPAKATPAKKLNGTKKAAASKGAAAKQCLLKSSNSLRKREGVSHPDGRSPVVLFHGVQPKRQQDFSDSESESGSQSGEASGAKKPLTYEQFAQRVQKPDLGRTSRSGDLHSDSGAGGGFYLTDSLIAAAQFACYHDDAEVPPAVYVLSYEWTPPPGISIRNYAPGEKILQKDLGTTGKGSNKKLKYGMLTAPMALAKADKHLTADFQQYAIVQQDLLNNNLKYLTTYNIPCKNVHKGADLPSEVYSKGQASNAEFASLAGQLQNGC